MAYRRTPVITKKDQAAYERLIGYRSNWCGFITDVLGLPEKYLWPKMRAIVESVQNNQLTAVRAGHSVSKTFGAGRIVVTFKTLYQPSTVITTAPSDNQVRNQLWREIHAAHAGSKMSLGGNMTALQWDVKPSRAVMATLDPAMRELWEKNFAIGFSTSPDTVTEYSSKAQGWHNEWVFIVIDEMAGVMPQITRTIMDSLVTNERVKVLALGNPTDATGEFARICEPGSGWNVIPVSVLDTPNYQEGVEVIPGVAGRAYEQLIRDTYGVDSNEYKVRVLGEFPTYTEGTFWGSRLAQAERDGRVGFVPWRENAKVYTFWDLGDMYTAILFVQLIGKEFRLFDFFYDNSGIGLPGYAKVLAAKPYIYQDHWTGPDILGSNRKSAATGRTLLDDAALLGIHFRVVEPHRFEDGIEAVRSLWPQMWIDKAHCADFLTACRNYKLRKNERLSSQDKPAYFNDPVKDWTCHPMDALRHAAMAYRYQMVVDGVQIGYPYPMLVADEEGDASRTWNAMTDGLLAGSRR